MASCSRVLGPLFEDLEEEHRADRDVSGGLDSPSIRGKAADIF